ncbi:MAG: amidohydrolase [Flavisolibacter sp.]|jgi:predicted amidohydrolase|nr:amidohydrolase [Flavisolibacter sp.]
MSKLQFTLLQTALFWEDKQSNLQSIESKLKASAGSGQVIVLPEMFTTGFSMSPSKLSEPMDGATMQWMKRLAGELKSVITGSFIAEEKSNYYNRMVWMLPTGAFGYYDKKHLFGFAGEDKHYSSGYKRLIASVNGWRINLLVCYDLRFPVWARQQFNDANEFEYDVLVYVANWPEKRSLAWKILLQARAIENQCYVIGVNRVGLDGNEINYSGNSMVIDPLGEVLYHKEDAEDLFTITLDKQHLDEARRKFPFWKDADRFELFSDNNAESA